MKGTPTKPWTQGFIITFHNDHIGEMASRRKRLEPFKMYGRLKIKCSCGHWKSVLINKVFIEQPSPESKVKVLIPMYAPLQVSKCEKCGQVVAEPKELIRIQRK